MDRPVVMRHEAPPGLEDVRVRMEAVLQRWNRRRADQTLKTRLSHIRLFGAFVGMNDVEPWRIAVELVRHGHGTAVDRVAAWLASMKEAGLAPTTRARRVYTLQSLVREIARDGLLRWDLSRHPGETDPPELDADAFAFAALELGI